MLLLFSLLFIGSLAECTFEKDATNSNCYKAVDPTQCYGTLEVPSDVNTICTNGFLNSRISAVKFATTSQVTIGEAGFKNSPSLHSITASAGIKEIGNESFSGCFALETLPETISWTKIGSKAFYQCYSLGEFTLGNKLTQVGEMAFSESGVVSVNLPSCTFGKGAFLNCQKLTTVTLTAHKVLEESLFENCINLETLSGIDQVTSIGKKSLAGCLSIRNFTFKNTVTYGEYALSGSGLEKLTLSSTTINLSVGLFANCVHLRTVALGDITTLPAELFLGCKKLVVVSTTNGLTSIGKAAFKDCKALFGIPMTNTITTLGDNAFENTNFRTFKLNAQMTTIGNYVFKNCKYLETIDLNGILNISEGMFVGCERLKTIKGIEKVTTFGKYALSTLNFDNFVLPSGSTIAEGVFKDCKKLKTVTITGHTTLPDNFFDGCELLTSITGFDSITSFGSYSMRNTGYHNIQLKSAVTYNKGTFSNCLSLKSVTLEEGVISIPEEMFKDSVNLASFNSFDKITTFGNHSFSNTLVSTVVLKSDGSITMGTGVFMNCVELNSFTLGSLTILNDFMFSGCKKLTTVNGIEKVTSIGMSSFENSGITNLIVSTALTTIKEAAFKGSALVSVTLTSSVQLIGKAQFAECKQLETVTLNGFTQLTEEMFSDCTSLDISSQIDAITSFGKNSMQNTKLSSFTFKSTSVTYATPFISNCKYLITVDLKEKTELEDYMFSGCTSLTNITGLDKVVKYGNYSLSGTSLREVSLVTGKTYGDGVFAQNTQLEIVHVLTNFVTLPDYTFAGCTSLANLENVDQITTFGKFSLSGTKFVSFTMSTSKKYGDGLFKDAKSLATLDFGNITEVPNDFVSGCESLVTLKNTSKILVINKNAFKNCKKLGDSGLSFLNSVMYFGEYSLSGTALRTVHLKTDSIVNEGLFESCSVLNYVEMNNVAFPSKIFKNCVSLSGVVQSNKVAFVGDEAYQNVPFEDVTLITRTIYGRAVYSGCTRLQHVTNEGLTNIADEMFKDCVLLSSHEGADKVTYYGDYSFMHCGLSDVSLNPKSLYGVGVFSQNPKLSTLKLKSVEYVGEELFEGCGRISSFSGLSTIKYLYTKSFYECSSMIRIDLNIIISMSENVFSNSLVSVTSTQTHSPLSTIDSFASNTKVYVTNDYNDLYFANIFVGQTAMSCTQLQYFDVATQSCRACDGTYYSLGGFSTSCDYDQTNCLRTNANCSLCIGSTCQQCKPTFYLESGVCKTVDCGSGIYYEGKCVPICKSNEELVNYVCTPKCTTTQERIDGVCYTKCALNEERVGTTCKTPCGIDQIRYTDDTCGDKCPVTQEIVSSACVDKCEATKERINGTCVEKCSNTQERINGICQLKCADGKELYNNNCVDLCKTYFTRNESGLCEQHCPTGWIVQGDKCLEHCDDTEDRIGDVCMKKCDATTQIRDDTSHLCVCKSDYELIAGKCLKKCDPTTQDRYEDQCKTKCIENEVRNSDTGICECKGSYETVNEKCLLKCDPFTTERYGEECKTLCKVNEHRNMETGNCECDSAYEYISNVCTLKCDPYTQTRDENTKECICNSNYDSINGKCLAKCNPLTEDRFNEECKTKCIENSHRNTNTGECDCDFNFEKYNGKCLTKCDSQTEDRVGETCKPKCVANAHRNQLTTECECDTNYDLVNEKCLYQCLTTEERVGEVCMTKCKEHEERNLQTNVCQCITGYEIFNNKCALICDPNEQQRDETTGNCLCKNGKEAVGTKCLDPCTGDTERVGEDCLAKCKENEVRKDRVCVCKDGYEFYESVCLLKCKKNQERNPTTKKCEYNCGEGTEPVGEECLPVCEKGYERQNGQCTRVVCDQGKVWENGECVDVKCDEGQYLEEGVCKYCKVVYPNDCTTDECIQCKNSSNYSIGVTILLVIVTLLSL
ncbi:hypothetical protein EIN_450550 [Entamoeba invadens IP1]|uniref:Kazal-like domain-containing protein n=1 Tax=Entamoeba invadens IP1 TaxID=370355 RepID=A0A0A1U363_ENTIV|nr:hypothetical protein EIN_450550 [Entamoeba invadens IP1]ELP85996.1 hypothetical protein EIN_450550 [Entamoeba invadens IP1]|eukprot:XP_004185342.1 hypothetical protein EIN_450550 [Entamoeba invadens IP1]